MASNIEVHANREEWLLARQSGIGASDAAVVLGESPYSSKIALYAEKRGLVPIDEGIEEEWHKWGHILEAPIAAEFARQTGFTIEDPGEYTIYRHPHNYWMFCTPDRLFTDADGRRGVLQIKTGQAYFAKDWDSGPPLHVEIQVQHELEVLGLDYGYIAALIGGNDFRMFEVQRNQSFINAMVREEHAFWQAVIEEDAPEPDATTSSSRALALLHPKDDGSEIELDKATEHWVHTWINSKAELEQLKFVISLAENRIRAAIGAATFGRCPDGVRVSLKHQTVKPVTISYERPEKTFRVLRKVKDG